MTRIRDLVIPPVAIRPEVPDPYEGERSHIEEGVCMRLGCGQKRAPHPDGGGETVLCEAHLEEVLRGEAKAPPLRRNLDYVSLARSSFLSAEDKD